MLVNGWPDVRLRRDRPKRVRRGGVLRGQDCCCCRCEVRGCEQRARIDARERRAGARSGGLVRRARGRRTGGRWWHGVACLGRATTTIWMNRMRHAWSTPLAGWWGDPRGALLGLCATRCCRSGLFGTTCEVYGLDSGGCPRRDLSRRGAPFEKGAAVSTFHRWTRELRRVPAAGFSC